MKAIFLTSCKNYREKDSIDALKYAAKSLEITACILDSDIILDEFVQLCLKLSIPIFNRENVCAIFLEHKTQKPKIGLAYHYHSIVNKEILEFPENGIINFHPAPVTEHRGVSGCTYAILHKYAEWGVTAHYMDEKVDSGDVIKVRRFDIAKHDCTALSLQRVNYSHYLELYKEIVDILATGVIPKGTPQEPDGVYYSRKQLEKDKSVHLTDTKETVDHKIKAMWFPPFHGANVTIDGEKYTLVNQRILDELGKIYEIAYGKSYNNIGE